ncbi:MAG: type II toxin-antitoxin system PemK/MazF family toxin [Candidatus Hydrogenedentota bacterium]
MVIKRFDVFLVTLDPAVGSEIRKTRPCLVVSPNEMHRNIDTVIIAPMTSKRRAYPSRVSCTFRRKANQIALDHIRGVDKSQLIKRLGTVGESVRREVLERLAEMFSP